MTNVLKIFILLCIASGFHAAPLFVESTSDSSNCGEIGDCLSSSHNCTEPCGCDNKIWQMCKVAGAKNSLYYYNKSTNECLLNVEYLKKLMTEKYDSEGKIRKDAEKIFRGVLVSVFVFIFCASFCAVSACVYCCHVNYSDRKLRNDVEALAQKLHRDGKLNKTEKKKTEDVAQSCNVVVEDAGVFVC